MKKSKAISLFVLLALAFFFRPALEFALVSSFVFFGSLFKSFLEFGVFEKSQFYGNNLMCMDLWSPTGSEGLEKGGGDFIHFDSETLLFSFRESQSAPFKLKAIRNPDKSSPVEFYDPFIDRVPQIKEISFEEFVYNPISRTMVVLNRPNSAKEPNETTEFFQFQGAIKEGKVEFNFEKTLPFPQKLEGSIKEFEIMEENKLILIVWKYYPFNLNKKLHFAICYILERMLSISLTQVLLLDFNQPQSNMLPFKISTLTLPNSPKTLLAFSFSPLKEESQVLKESASKETSQELQPDSIIKEETKNDNESSALSLSHSQQQRATLLLDSFGKSAVILTSLSLDGQTPLDQAIPLDFCPTTAFWIGETSFLVSGFHSPWVWFKNLVDFHRARSGEASLSLVVEELGIEPGFSGFQVIKKLMEKVEMDLESEMTKKDQSFFVFSPKKKELKRCRNIQEKIRVFF